MIKKSDLSLFIIFVLAFYIFLTIGNLLHIFNWGNFLIDGSWKGLVSSSASLISLVMIKFLSDD